MQRDIHMYATLAIAKAAGYSDDDAVLLAWADMETDYTLQVKWYNCLWSNLGLYFHFWPGDPNELICRVDSELSKRIMQSVTAFLPDRMEADKIIARGIGLHGLQDTYSHQGWVGKFSQHNVLPAWSHNKFTPSLPFPYGHSPKGKEPDIANATWFDPRIGRTISNPVRIRQALDATAKILGLVECPPDVQDIFDDEELYDTRKAILRDLADMPEICFSKIRRDMLKKYRGEFMRAAKEQARILKGYLK